MCQYIKELPVKNLHDDSAGGFCRLVTVLSNQGDHLRALLRLLVAVVLGRELHGEEWYEVCSGGVERHVEG